MILALLIAQNASQWKGTADAALAAKQYEKASAAYERAAALYDKLGDPNAAKVLRNRAARWRTEITLHRLVETAPAARLALHEPAAGCYLGVNVERDDRERDPVRFEAALGRRHALFFMYRQYGKEFPLPFAARCRAAGAGLQIAFEPRSIADVKDDRYLREFAADARRSGLPIFLRFAGEMNGAWTRYTGNPEAYKRMFRLVAARMHADAPNVAMVWCPNEIPEAPIPSYYPGADAVDWVGVNFYAVPFNDADRARDATFRMPTDALEFVYKKYAGRHPMMVGEWAASSRSVVDGKDASQFAARKIREFYGRLPLRYPRVKAVSWLSYDAMRYAKDGRRLNDYSLTKSPTVSAAYVRATDDAHFLPHIGDLAMGSWTPGAEAYGGTVRILVRTFDPAAMVTVRRGSLVVKGAPSSPVEIGGKGPVDVVVTDARGGTIARRRFE